MGRPGTLLYGLGGGCSACPSLAGPRSSGDRAPPSGGGSAGSNPAGGASVLPSQTCLIFMVTNGVPQPSATPTAFAAIPDLDRPLNSAVGIDSRGCPPGRRASTQDQPHPPRIAGFARHQHAPILRPPEARVKEVDRSTAAAWQ